jgi:hypothetical protein
VAITEHEIVDVDILEGGGIQQELIKIIAPKVQCHSFKFCALIP